MLKLFCENPKGQHLGASHGFLSRGSVRKNTRKLGDLGEPAAIQFLFVLDLEIHGISLPNAPNPMYALPIGGEQKLLLPPCPHL